MSYDTPLSARADLGMAAARERQPLPAAPRPVGPRTVLATAELECYDGASIWRRGGEDVHERFDPLDYDAVQPADIPVLHRHDRDRRVGHVLHLEWGQGSPARILAAFHVDAAEAEIWEGQDVFISPGTKRNANGRLVLDHLGLVPETARIAATPVRWAGSTFERRRTWTAQTTPGFHVLTRAYDASRKRAKGAGIPIVGHPGPVDEQIEEQRARRGDPGPLAAHYWRKNGEDGLFYSGGIGKILRVS
jgi:hypothetical protein